MTFEVGDCIVLAGERVFIALPQNDESTVQDYIDNQSHTRRLKIYDKKKAPNASYIILEIKGGYALLMMTKDGVLSKVFAMLEEGAFVKL